MTSVRQAHLAPVHFRQGALRLRVGDRVQVMQPRRVLPDRQTSGVVLGANAHGIDVAVQGKRAWVRKALRLDAHSILQSSGPADRAQQEAAFTLLRKPVVHANYQLDLMYAYGQFSPARIWNGIAESILRDWHDHGQVPRALLNNRSRDVEQQLFAMTGGTHFGGHYNLHGGLGKAYVAAGGIRAIAGGSAVPLPHKDIIAAPLSGQAARQGPVVWFFDSALTVQAPLLKMLEERHPAHLFSRVRMGSVFLLFDMHSPALSHALGAGHILRRGDCCMSFTQDWFASQQALPGVGIPAHDLLLPPLPLFDGTVRELFGWRRRLDYDFRSFATLTYIGAVAEAYPKPFAKLPQVGAAMAARQAAD